MSNSVVQAFLVRTKPGVSVAEFERAAAGSHLFVNKLDDFLGRRLLYAEGRDQWLDIVEWSSWEAADKAAEAISASRECLDFISMVDEAEMRELRLREIALP